MYSDMNMYLWQSTTWIFFHKLSLNQDISKNEHYLKFFNSFKIIIPCSMCRNHYISMLNEPQFNLNNHINKKNLFNFTINIHNKVNKRLGSIEWSHNQANKHYNSFFLKFNDVKRFISIFIFHNFKKGPEKTQNLFIMLISLAHIFPRYFIREKLIKYVEKVKPNVNNFKKWMSGYFTIINNTMK